MNESFIIQTPNTASLPLYANLLCFHPLSPRSTTAFAACVSVLLSLQSAQIDATNDLALEEQEQENGRNTGEYKAGHQIVKR